jgi:arylsulfatase A-like enzyme
MWYYVGEMLGALRANGLAEDTLVVYMSDHGEQAGERGVISDCHFRKTATEYGRKTGIKWLSCTEK